MQRLRDFDFSRGGESKYPWAEWFASGDIIKLSRSEGDFTSKVAAVRANANRAAKRLGYKLEVRTPDDDTVVFKATRERGSGPQPH
jgi:hypothetical protein